MFIDIHDDLGTFIKNWDHIVNSDLVKQASWKEREDIHDRDFAVIVIDPNGDTHRKLAMFDPGTTYASSLYLLNQDIPSSSVAKLAASNLAIRANHFNLPSDLVTALEKVAAEAKEDAEIIDERIVQIKAANYQMGYGPMNRFNANAVLRPGSSSATMPGMPPMNMPGMANMSGNMMGKYASNEFDLVSKTEQNWESFSPVEKRNLALHLKEASSVAHIPSKISKYAGTSLNPDFSFLMQKRLDYVKDEDLRESYSNLEKLAYTHAPEEVIEALSVLDDRAGIYHKYNNSSLPDPVLTVLGEGVKVAENWSWSEGGNYLNERQIRQFASSNHDSVDKLFTDDIKIRFRKDPIKTFESLPDEQKIIMSRLATQTRFSEDGGL